MKISGLAAASSWRAIARVGLAALAALIGVLGLAIALMNPSRQDVVLLAIFLAGSGLVSLALGYLVIG